jgi:hypothetical protein
MKRLWSPTRARNVRIHQVWGTDCYGEEYVRTSGWDSSTVIGQPGKLRIALSAYIAEGRRGRPESLTARLEMGGLTEDLLTMDITSLREAKRVLEALHLDEPIRRLRARFYSRDLAECVYRIDGSDAIPWRTNLGPWADQLAYPVGRYVEVHRTVRQWSGNARTLTTRSQDGVGSNAPVPPEFAGVGDWIRDPYALIRNPYGEAWA